MKSIFSPFDIIWIKNVTDSSEGQTYMNCPAGSFVLHFPDRHKYNCASPKAGEVILIYQKINHQNVFTHLVTPIDNNMVADEVKTYFKYGRHVQIIAFTPIPDLIHVSSTLWKNVNFQGISQGNACRIRNISKIKNVDHLLHDIWNRFTPFLCNNELTIENDVLVEVL